jgi:outer membrane protein TolC
MRLRIDLAGMNARKEVVAKAIDEGRKSAAEQAERDAVAIQLKEVVKLLEDSVRLTQEAFKAGATTPTEARRAEIDLASAKVKLLERQQLVAQQSGAADVTRLADQLRDLSASLVETRARLEATDEVLATHERVQEIVEQEEAARRQIDKLRGMIEHVEKVKLDRRLGVPGEPAGAR